MRHSLPLFPVTTVGSWPCRRELLLARGHLRAGELSRGEFRALALEELARCAGLQAGAGVDLVTDGEQTRDNFHSFVAERVEGVRLTSLADGHLSCIGRVRRREPLAAAETARLKSVTGLPVKVTLPGPYLLTRAMWAPEPTRAAYGSMEELGRDVVALLQDEIRDLCALDVAMIQLDEPLLTTSRSPAEELDFAVTLINQVTDLIHELSAARSALHVCRGNRSTREGMLQGGSYRQLEPVFERMRVSQLVLEYASPRAGDLMRFDAKELGLGVVDPRTPEVESAATIVARVTEALALYPREKLFLNPDGGFATISARPMNAEIVAVAKVRAMAEAARELRRQTAPGATPAA